MPGFPFGPIRPNTCAGLPLTARVLVPAVRRSLAGLASGAAVALIIGRKGMETAMATPDAGNCRRGRRAGFQLDLNGDLALCRISIKLPPFKLVQSSLIS